MKKNKILLYTCILVAFLNMFYSCKKYPENKGIHLTNPKKRLIGNKAIITMYKINSDDSLPLLSSQFGQDINSIQWQWGDQYDSDKFFEKTLSSGSGNMDFINNNKTLVIEYESNYYNFPFPKLGYNIFSTKVSYWEILKLYQKNSKTVLKLKREYNGKIYIIQFNS